MEWGPLILSFKLAFITTILLLLIGIPLAIYLSNSKSRWTPVFETLISLPLILPPTVLGFYLLLAFSPTTGVGHFLNEVLGLKLAFSFPGLVIASIIYSLPFMVHPIQAGLSNLPSSLKEASYVLGKSKWITLTKVLLPNIKSSLLTGTVLAFAHTIGEFGIVLMIGGNIPDKTRVVSIAIYDEVEAMNYVQANFYAMVLIAICFSILLFVYLTNRGYFKKQWL